MPKTSLVTKADRKAHDERLRKELAGLQDRMRADFYRRQGIEPPEKEVVPSSNKVLTREGVPVRIQRSQRDWVCSRDGCNNSFWLNTRQRKAHDEGARRFFCSQECRLEATRKPLVNGTKYRELTWKQKRDLGAKKIPTEQLRVHVLPLLSENGGRYTWTSLAYDLGYWKGKEGARYGDTNRLRGVLGYSLKVGQPGSEFARRETLERFERILGEEFWK